MSDQRRGVLSRLSTSERGVTPVVGKVMEVAIVVLYLGVVTSALYGGTVPEYRDETGARIGDRVLASAASGIENAIPPATRRVSSSTRVEIPTTIRGDGYWLRIDRGALVIDHPRSELSSRIPLGLPPSVVRISGRWSSYEPAIVTVEGSSDGLIVRLVRG